MGTRADFYAGTDPETMEWLGSIAWDGYDDDIPESILDATSEADYRAAVAAELAGRRDGTTPADGWPWPWADSRTTDYSYSWDPIAQRCMASDWGTEWRIPRTKQPDEDRAEMRWPDMSSRKAVTLGERSGLIVVRGKP